MDAKTKTQSLRKGKKAWRKNILVDDINLALDANRERQVLHGDDTDGDFVIDTEGSSRPKNAVSVLKTTEILANKSKVPALASRKTKLKVSKARAEKLMILAGRLATGSKGKARTDTEGLVKGSNVDLWAEDDTSASKKINEPTRISFTKASKAPATLKHQPLHLHTEAEVDDLVHAGKSYNPSVEAWKSLVDREYVLENDAQMKVQALEQEQERIQHLMETLKDDELDGGESSAEEDVAEPEDPEEKYRLSVNERTEVKRKTRTQKNREARHKQQLELLKKMRELKSQLRDLQNLLAIQQEVAEKAALQDQKPRVPKKYKSHSKHEPLFTPIEVKLLDELTNNLRAVKPEGNPFYEQMYKLQMSGKVEARVPVAPRKRYKQKLTEKWSYKQFK
ncbi:putative ribosomal biogenesis protein [Metschnikowia bicuspidata var. bicuspidata NRRL YB-4993]|uniref:Ribosome biogenesis protein NOP53 n=1 Tax=Metschnikowia bicuspidata var. bicuspidata NRRL YB-4993 TaxID=869754 RepID=A0A1A0HD89_9ASCO|nr:putative ribosomal biogenesis protein [Metschnikowia bicuspidata var. bicuspidata NRRL YB-4993]OBA21981.1 putative ribosomal biogenesis protein [Metschnikowia bicuspidata var. bicuspidata NRRL YB-4993]